MHYIFFNISKSTLYNWINLYDKQLLYVSNNRSTYKSKISPPIHKYIITYVTKKVSFKNLRRYIRNIFNVFVSKSSIYRILAINNITNKKISNKIIPKKFNNSKIINKFKTHIKTINSDNIVSIDESSFDEHLIPFSGWSKKGHTIKKIFNTSNKKRITLTLAVTKNKIIDYDMTNGSSNSHKFKTFLADKVLPKINNSFLLMDNVKFHHSQIVKDLVANTTNKIIYNIPYNPETNPIEFVFSSIKKFVRDKKFISNDTLSNLIKRSLKLVTPNKLKNIFKHSLNI